jgi:cytochrome c-type biogenesis protein
MSGAPIATAVTAGALAAFNPCGFAMLPAYLASFVGSGGTERQPLVVRLLRATRVGAAVTLGFIVVFGIVGLFVETVSGALLEYMPWLTTVVGICLLVMGIAMVRGFEPKFSTPRVQFDTSRNDVRSMFLYGVSYAVVSLGCTLPVFLIQVATGFERGGFFSGSVRYLAYAGGMGLVVITLTLAVALAQQGFVRQVRRILPYVNRVSGLFLILAGAYLAYYGWFSRRLLTEGGDISGGGLVDWVDRRSSDAQQWLQDRGDVLIIALVILGGAIAMLAVLRPRFSTTTTPGKDTSNDH